MKDISVIAVAVLVVFILVAHSQQLSKNIEKDTPELSPQLNTPVRVLEPKTQDNDKVSEQEVSLNI